MTLPLLSEELQFDDLADPAAFGPGKSGGRTPPPEPTEIDLAPAPEPGDPADSEAALSAADASDASAESADGSDSGGSEEAEPPIHLVRLGDGQTQTEDSWLISEWSAGQSTLTRWSADNVTFSDQGILELHLTNEDDGSGRPVVGGEIQSIATASYGTWSWVAQAPEMQDGAVFGMFLYREDWQNDPWLEFDFEFVGSDTTQVQLNIHMESAEGEHVKLSEAYGSPYIVDLGFDAAQGFHTYEITLLEGEALFAVDGDVVGQFDASDMPDGTWSSGGLNSFVDIWAVDETGLEWAGEWDQTNDPLVAQIASVSTPETLLIGTEADDVLIGTDGADRLEGLAGNDTLVGGAGDDVIVGGRGVDVMTGGAGADVFVFESVHDAGVWKSRDTITDFEPGVDKLSFETFDANIWTSEHEQLSFAGSDPTPNSLWVVERNSLVVVKIDATGDMTADFELALTGISSISESDFIL